jgi:hypothetical protein
VAGRRPLKFKPREADYNVAETANINAVLFAPVMAHYWAQKELKDGTYNYIDLLDILEAMDVESENRWRDYEHERRRHNEKIS